MKEDDESWKNLSIQERLSSNLWKARKHTYNELTEIFQRGDDQSQVMLSNFAKDPELVKRIITDSNVSAQESALEALTQLIKFGGKETVVKIRNEVVSSICEKALIASKENTRKYAIEALLLIIEFDKAEPVIQEMTPFLSSRLPKLVTAIVKAVNEIYSAYGCDIVNSDLIISHIPKLFAHADRNVRAETTRLSITIRSYIGDRFEGLVFESLKPIQQRDLSAAFTKIDSKPEPTRILKIHQKGTLDEGNNGKNEEVDDVEMTDYNVDLEIDITADVDPWDFAVPVDVISKLPADFNERLMSSKWKDRVEVLKEIAQEFNVERIKNADFNDLIRSLARSVKDVNIYVVISACEILVSLANGIRDQFERYVSIVLEPLLDRTKEKKKTVTDALAAALNVCFKYSSLNEILQTTIDHMNHKTPQIKFESMQFLLRCLRSINKVPAKHEVDLIMEEAIKLLSDSQLIVRDTSAELIGTLMKIIGPNESKKYMEKVDKRHQKRIEEFSESAVTNVKEGRGESSVRSRNSLSNSLSHKITSSANTIKPAMRKSLIGEGVSLRKTSESTVPAKRGATSPLKRDHQNLTAKSLRAETSFPSHTVSSKQVKEIEELKAAQRIWMDEKQQLLNQIENYQRAQDDSLRQVMMLNEKIEDYQVKFTSLNVTLRSKEAKLIRLQGDLNESKQREVQLDQRIKMLESQKMEQKPKEDINTSFERKSNEINKRISTLSIDSEQGLQAKNDKRIPSISTDGAFSKISASIYDLDDNDDSWKRATAVTNDLKAKIQRMKERTRTLNILEN